jgi:hypothetical protein
MCSGLKLYAAKSNKIMPPAKIQSAVVYGREAGLNRIIVKFKTQTKLSVKSRKDKLSKLGESITKDYKHISDIAVLEPNNQTKAYAKMS